MARKLYHIATNGTLPEMGQVVLGDVVRGILGVHGEKGSWTITHILTGHRIGGRFDKASAMAVARVATTDPDDRQALLNLTETNSVEWAKVHVGLVTLFRGRQIHLYR